MKTDVFVRDEIAVGQLWDLKGIQGGGIRDEKLLGYLNFRLRLLAIWNS